jgi:hypothetical protein
MKERASFWTSGKPKMSTMSPNPRSQEKPNNSPLSAEQTPFALASVSEIWRKRPEAIWSHSCEMPWTQPTAENVR